MFYAELTKIIPNYHQILPLARALGPVVKSIVSLMSSLRGQLIKCFTTLSPKTLKFFVDKMREAVALQKLLRFFQQKILAYLRYCSLKF